MNYKQFTIQFDTPYEKWVEDIKQGLDNNGILYDTEVPINICKSLILTTNKVLKFNGHKPRKYFYYRCNVVKKLRTMNKRLEIKSNNTLWKCLEYFTDLKDFSSCFDINIVSLNGNKLNTDNTATIKTNNLIESKINIIRQYNQTNNKNDKIINDLLDLIEYIVKE